jgi:hypothetical protein
VPPHSATTWLPECNESLAERLYAHERAAGLRISGKQPALARRFSLQSAVGQRRRRFLCDHRASDIHIALLVHGPAILLVQYMVNKFLVDRRRLSGAGSSPTSDLAQPIALIPRHHTAQKPRDGGFTVQASGRGTARKKNGKQQTLPPHRNRETIWSIESEVAAVVLDLSLFYIEQNLEIT